MPAPSPLSHDNAAARMYASTLLRIDKTSRKHGKFAAMEAKLHTMLKERRKRGRRCSPRWLSHSARSLMSHEFVAMTGSTAFRAGPRWRRRFLSRFHLTTRRKTNRKNTTWEEAKPLLQQHFKRFLIWLKQKSAAAVAKGLTPCSTWGVFPPHFRFNVDQVPLPFINCCEDTYEEVGATQVRINGLQPGLFKRQATAQLVFRAAAPPRPPASDLVACARYDTHIMRQPRACIIFRGTGTRITEREKSSYAEDVDVLWQPKAWVDRPTAVEWVKKSFSRVIEADLAAGVATKDTQYLLLQDNLDAQLQPAYVAELGKLQTASRWLLAGKTDYVQPVDAGLGRQIKLYMGEEMDAWLEDDDNLEKWESNVLTAGDRRVLMTHWLSVAWAKAMAKTDTVRKYFEHTGALMTLDGDHGVSLFKFDGVNEPFEFMSAILPTSESVLLPSLEDADEVGSDVDDREPGLDDDDDEEDGDGIVAAPFELPRGFRLASSAPSPAALEFKNGDSPSADMLVGCHLIFKWAAVGWCEGVIVRRNKDARRKLDGQPYNFFAYYEIDGEEAAHVLEHSMLVLSAAAVATAAINAWALLEPEPGAGGSGTAASSSRAPEP